MENPGNHVMYYLSDGPEKAFASEELMLIPEDTELPPDYVQEWYYLSNWIDINCELSLWTPCRAPNLGGSMFEITVRHFYIV